MSIRPALSRVISVLLLQLILTSASRGEILGPAPNPDSEKVGTVELYKPNYFIFANMTEGEQGQAKFQVSFRTALFPRLGLYVGYTQESFWDLYVDSAPFLEHDFNPELFLASNPKGRSMAFLQKITHLKQIDRAQLGLEHQSTGVSGPNSRSWNRVYGSLRIRGTPQPWLTLRAYPRLWWILDAASENDDIASTTSFDGESRLGGNLILVARVRDRSRFSIEVGTEYQLYEVNWRPSTREQNFYLYGRLWNGFGDGLVNYNQFTRTLGFGISLIKT